jgi:hypothetical protein
MAPRAVTKARVDWAYAELLRNRATHRVVADLAAREGISARQARRIVGEAHKGLAEDLDHVERPEMLAKFVLALEVTVERSLEAGQYNATIGAVRTLADLLQFPRPTTASPERPHYTGRRYG